MSYFANILLKFKKVVIVAHDESLRKHIERLLADANVDLANASLSLRPVMTLGHVIMAR